MPEQLVGAAVPIENVTGTGTLEVLYFGDRVKRFAAAGRDVGAPRASGGAPGGGGGAAPRGGRGGPGARCPSTPSLKRAQEELSRPGPPTTCSPSQTEF